MEPRSPQEWVLDQAATLGKGEFRSIALDFLLGKTYVRPWNVDIAVKALKEAVVGTASSDREHMMALVIPLRPSDRIRVNPPSFDDLDLNDVEPPSLYLFERYFFGTHADTFEEYRMPLAWPTTEVAHGYVDVSYTCFRDPRSRAEGWEFSRAIWFKHFDSA
jgi:hypothetical protein